MSSPLWSPIASLSYEEADMEAEHELLPASGSVLALQPAGRSGEVCQASPFVAGLRTHAVDAPHVSMAETHAEPPIIEWASSGKHVMLGKTELLRVRALGLPSVSYQWYFNGKLLPSATAADLTLPAISIAQCGTYFCKVCVSCS